MILLHIIAFLVVVTWFASLGPLLGYSIDWGFDALEDIFDPIARYDSGEFNLFGVVTLTVLLNLLFMPMALMYWFYQLCTVGRR